MTVYMDNINNESSEYVYDWKGIYRDKSGKTSSVVGRSERECLQLIKALGCSDNVIKVLKVSSL